MTDDAAAEAFHLLDLTLPTTAENLALDEALLDEFDAQAAGDRDEQAAPARQVLRLWTPGGDAVILGRHSALDMEVNETYCREQGIPILRRMSGGATVMIGPGCLMYSVLIGYQQHPKLRDLSAAHHYVLQRMANVLPGVQIRGTSDLALASAAGSEHAALKFAGNSLRCKRHAFMYHGTFLCDFPLARISAALRHPPRQPEYRQDRQHADFITNYGMPEAELRARLIAAWGANDAVLDWPRQRTVELVATRYADEAWNRER